MANENTKEQHFPHPGGCQPGHYGPCRSWRCCRCDRTIFIDTILCDECHVRAAEKREVE